MAFKHIHEKKGLSLPSLIDIIFLLLIFFMLTINISSIPGGDYPLDYFDLPKVRISQLDQASKVLQTLMIQIEHEKNNESTEEPGSSSPLVVYALWPDEREPITISTARAYAQEHGKFAYLVDETTRRSNPDIPDISAEDFIKREIEQYAGMHFNVPGDSNSYVIDVRAVNETTFKTINHILNVCSELDIPIKRINIRVNPGEAAEDGF
jgi:hypothetical protein